MGEDNCQFVLNQNVFCFPCAKSLQIHSPQSLCQQEHCSLCAHLCQEQGRDWGEAAKAHLCLERGEKRVALVLEGHDLPSVFVLLSCWVFMVCGLQVPRHDWIRTESDSSKCDHCPKKIKTLTGKRCAFCHRKVREQTCSLEFMMRMSMPLYCLPVSCYIFFNRVNWYKQ